MNTFVFSLVLLALASFVTADRVSFKFNYELRDSSLYPNGYIPGTVYYRYDQSNISDSVVRYDHTVYSSKKPVVITELEYYPDKILFKICGSVCEGSVMIKTPQQWWYKDGDKAGTTDSDGFTTYTREPGSYGITSLKLNSKNIPTSQKYLKEVTFSTGRVVRAIDGYASVDYSNSKFDPNSGGVTCITKPCAKYMDLVFVADSSISVGSSNWEKMKTFMKNVAKDTDISEASGAIAAVGFGGTNYYEGDGKELNCSGTFHNRIYDTDSGWADGCTKYNNISHYVYYLYGRPMGKAKVSSGSNPETNPEAPKTCFDSKKKFICTTTQEYVLVQDSSCSSCPKGKKCLVRCDGDFGLNPRSSGYFNHTVYFPLTYSTSNAVSTEITNKVNYKGGCTCQELGLDEAITLLENSPRIAKFGKVPQRVVIVLTDGADFCVYGTSKKAKYIRENLGALLIEVGIGLECNRDKEYLKEISSHIAGSPAYFDASDYSSLNSYLKEMIQTACTSDYSESSGCDPRCELHGFCGCDKQCLCPSCDESTDVCSRYKCDSDNSASAYAGCYEDVTNCTDNNLCTVDRCTSEGKCEHTEKVCEKKYTCTDVQCDPRTGNCVETNKSSLCSDLNHPAACYKGVCAPGTPGADPVTGCTYEYTCTGDHIAVVDPNTHQITSGCYEYNCMEAGGNYICDIKDLCTDLSDGCNTYGCKNGNCAIVSSVKCQLRNNCDAEAVCHEGNCTYKPVDAAVCLNRLIENAKNHDEKQYNPNNRWFSSDQERFRYYNCGEYSCNKNARNSTSTKNQAGVCIFTPGSAEDCSICAEPVEGDNDHHETVESCAKKLESYREEHPRECIADMKCRATSTTESECVPVKGRDPCQPTLCYDVTCNATSDGGFECIPKPNARWQKAIEDNTYKCMKVECNDKTGDLYLVDASGEICKQPADLCTISVCVNETGRCVTKEKCEHVGCKSVTCNPKIGYCNYTSLCEQKDLCSAIICADEVTDRCAYVPKDLTTCGNITDNCHKWACDLGTGKCVEEELQYPDPDKCHNYTCVPTTVGDPEWVITDKCDDGLVCTVDSCIAKTGECINDKRDCAELNMTGFGDCYIAVCSEKRKNGCYRKVYANSVFDECGNCIRGYSEDGREVSQEELSACKDALKPYVPAAIGAGIIAAIVIACIIAAAAMTTAGTLATRELIRRARAANSQGAHDNPLFEEDGQEMENPTFVGTE